MPSWVTTNLRNQYMPFMIVGMTIGTNDDDDCQSSSCCELGESVQLEAELMNLRNDVEAGR